MDNNGFSMNWLNSWSDLQKKVWSDWTDSVRKATPDAGPFNPFALYGLGGEDMADSIWSSFSPFQASSHEDLVRRNMMGAMNNFFSMGQGVFETFQKMGQQGNATTEEWTAELDKNLAKFKEFFSDSVQAQFSPFSPLSNWDQMMGNMPFFNNEMMQKFLSGVPGMDDPKSIEKMLTASLSAPGLGITREKQEGIQKAVLLTMNFQKLYSQFQGMMNESRLKSIELFRERLISMAKEGKPLESLRDLHVLWVDCNEETNALTVSSKEYQELNPQMMSAMLELRAHMQFLTDEALEAMNLPNRRELNSAYKQIHSLKRRVRKLEQQAKGQNTGAAKETKSSEVEALRKEVAELKKAVAAAPAAAKTTRKAPARKTTKAPAKTAAAKAPAKTAAKAPAKAAAKKGE